MRILFTILSFLVHAMFMPITLAISVGIIFGAWVIGRQLRPMRTCDSGGELGDNEWLGHPRGEWLGA